MEITYDEAKRLSNIKKHGLDFAELDLDFFDEALVDATHSGRWKAIGVFRDGMLAVVFATLGSEAISLISMRAASRAERRLYAHHRKETP